MLPPFTGPDAENKGPYMILALLLASFQLSISSVWVAWNAKGLFPHLCWTLPGAAFLWIWTYVTYVTYVGIVGLSHAMLLFI